MTTYQKILEIGRAAIRAKERVEGKIQLLEEYLGLPVSTDEFFADQDLPALQQRYKELESLHKARFKWLG